MTPDPDAHLSPPDYEEQTDAEYRERRRVALDYISNEELVDMLCQDAPEVGAALWTAILFPMKQDREPNEADRKHLSDRLFELMTPRIKRYLEGNT